MPLSSITQEYWNRNKKAGRRSGPGLDRVTVFKYY